MRRRQQSKRMNTQNSYTMKTTDYHKFLNLNIIHIIMHLWPSDLSLYIALINETFLLGFLS